MFIELVDHLRCLHPHADSWLVASAERMAGREIVEGTLGCPVCAAEYRVEGGAVVFGGPRPSSGSSALQPPPSGEVGDGAALRAAALLGLAGAGGFALLCGAWATYARPLLAIVDVQFVVLNPPPGVESREGVNVLYAPPCAIPLAAASLRAAALDAAAVADGFMPEAVRVLRGRGRLVAPASAPLPADVAELARDAEDWVAERAGITSPPVRLGLARHR